MRNLASRLFQIGGKSDGVILLWYEVKNKVFLTLLYFYFSSLDSAPYFMLIVLLILELWQF